MAKDSQLGLTAITATSIGAALVSDNEPTVVSIVNVIVVALIAAMVPVTSVRCPTWIVGVAAVPITACGLRADGPAVLGPSTGLAAVAVLAALLLTQVDAPLLRAAAGALCVQGALRLQWPEPLGASAIVAGVCLTSIIIVGWARGTRTERSVLASVAAVVLVVFVAGAAATAMMAMRSYDDARSGLRATERAANALANGNRETASTELDRAERLLSGVDETVHSWWATPAMWIPVVSQHLDLARSLSTQGLAALRAAQDANERADPRALRLDAASIDLNKVDGFAEPLDRAVRALAALEETIAQSDSEVWIAGPIRPELHSADGDLARVRRDASNALEVVKSAPGMLGREGSRHYFLAIMTPVEMRGTIGIIGNYGEVSAAKGTVSLDTVGRNDRLNRLSPGETRTLSGPADYLDRYASFEPATTWQNVPLSPDWPTNASVIAELYPQSGGRTVDGVIGVDPIAMSGLLSITGPITVPSWPDPITARNARRILLTEQYAKFTDRGERVDFLGEIATAIWTKLIASAPDPVSLIDALGPATREGHLMMWSAHPTEQDLFERLGIAGQIAPANGGNDSVAITGINVGGDKLDAYLERSVEQIVDWNPTSQSIATSVSVELRNEAPPSGLPAYVTGLADGSTGVEGQNRSLTTIYSPLGLIEADLNGENVGPDVKKELDRNAIGQFLAVDPGATTKFTVQLAGPWTGTQYRLDVTRQVTVRPETHTVTVRVPDGWRITSSTPDAVRSADGASVTITLGLERDQHLVFDASRT